MLWFVNNKKKLIYFLAQISRLMEDATPEQISMLIDNLRQEYGQETADIAQRFIEYRTGAFTRLSWSLFFTEKQVKKMVDFLAEYDCIAKANVSRQLDLFFWSINRRELKILGQFLSAENEVYRQHLLFFHENKGSPGSQGAKDGSNG